MLACRCLSSSFSVSLSLRVFGRERENLGGVKINPNVWFEGNYFIRLQCDVLIWNRAGVVPHSCSGGQTAFFCCGSVCVEASVCRGQCVWRPASDTYSVLRFFNCLKEPSCKSLILLNLRSLGHKRKWHFHFLVTSCSAHNFKTYLNFSPDYPGATSKPWDSLKRTTSHFSLETSAIIIL